MEHPPTLLQRLVADATVESLTITGLIAGHRRAPPFGVPDALERLIRKLEALQTEAARLADPAPSPHVVEVRANEEKIAALEAHLKAPTPRKTKAPRLSVFGKPVRQRKEIELEVRAFLSDPNKVKLVEPPEPSEPAWKVWRKEMDAFDTRIQRTVTELYQDQFGPRHERYPR